MDGSPAWGPGGGGGHLHPTSALGGSGTMGPKAQGKVSVVGNASETGINPSLAAPYGCCCRECRNYRQAGRDGAFCSWAST